ncbi:AI-2E family transporter [Candidatus Saccharibacteria bacterium oral taxon 488]|nr:AI-2E family transporter [Candidatus Saccharibacteria bacterium oral taxon 488]
MKVRIEIDTKTFVRFWLVVIGFGLAGLMIYSARDALMVLGTALFLALALNAPVRKLASWLPGKSRLGGTALAFMLLIIILTSVIWFVVPPLVQQSAKFAETLPGLVNGVNEQWHGLKGFVEQNGLQPQIDSLMNNIREQASSWAASFGANILGSIGSLASFLASAFLVLVLTFLMLLEGQEWMERLWRLYRDEQRRDHHKVLVGKIYNVVTGYIVGQLTVSGIGSLCAGAFVFGMSWFIPEIAANLAMPTILLVFLLSLIPMFGATIAGVVVGLMLMLNSVSAGVIYLIYFVIYQQIENNFIAPVIQGKKVELSALAILVAVTVGLYVGGLVGGVVAIPIAGSLKVLMDDYLAHNREPQAPPRRSPLKKALKKVAETKPAE